ncbi:MAG: hypothetical protein EAY65_01765 [Alphaproteobacteria bacterium]|nr:MAG: hypothetical protein EAY65_01765 [Alphaproteobacteria bacterium]
MSIQNIYEQTVVPGAAQAHASAIAAAPVMKNNIVQTNGLTKPKVSADYIDLVQQKAQIEEEVRRNSVGRLVTDTVGNISSLGVSALAKGTSVAGVAGHAATLGVSLYTGNKTAKDDLEDLRIMYMDMIVQEFNIPPQEVTTDHVRWLAERPNQDQLLAQIHEIDHRMGRAATTSLAGIAGSAAGMYLAPLLVGAALAPFSFGATLIPGVVLTLGGALIGGSIASGHANSIVNCVTGIDPNATGYAELKRMNDKITRGEQVNAIDTFKALLAGDKDFQNIFLESTKGKNFDDLDVSQQAKVLEEHHPKLLEACHQLGYMINLGIIPPARLMTLPTLVLDHKEKGGAKAAYDLVAYDIKFGHGVRKDKMMELEAQRASLEQSYGAPDALTGKNVPVKGGWAEAELNRRATSVAPQSIEQGGFVAAEMERRSAAGQGVQLG